MNAIAYSQISLQKTHLGSENAVIINEIAMDTLSQRLIRFQKCLSDNAQFQLELALALKTNEKLSLEIDKEKSSNANLELQKNELLNQLEIKDKIHDNDIKFWKEKAKGKFRSFLLGCGVGGLVVALLTLI